MCFKTRLCCVIVAAEIFISGCGIKLGEKAPQAGAVSYSGKGYSCLSQIPQHMEQYLNDKLSVEEIDQFFACMKRAFTNFAQLTHGRDSSNYAPDEIRRFLESYFLKDRKISDELLHEFMVIKQSLVGGDEGRVARSELMDAVDILEDIRVAAVSLKPHIKYLNPKMLAAQNPGDLGAHMNAANDALKNSIQVFAGRLQKSHKIYPLANLEKFLNEFRIFAKIEDHDEDSEKPKIRDWIALLKAFKEVTVSPADGHIIRESEWQPLLSAMSSWYMAYLQCLTGIRRQPIFYGTGLQNAIYLEKQVIAHMETALATRSNSTVTFDELGRLFQALHVVGWLPKNVRPSSVDRVLKALVNNMLGEELANGLNPIVLNKLHGEFQRWANVQRSLDEQFPHAANSSVPSLQTRAVLGGFRELTDEENADLAEFNRVKTLMPRPLYNDKEPPRVILAPLSKAGYYGVSHGFTSLSIMNLERSLLSLVYHGYSSEARPQSLWDYGIKSHELQAFYVDFRDLGIDLGLIDKRNVNSGNRAFIEGKLFTYSSQGLIYDPDVEGSQGRLTFVEALEYFAFLYSGGELSEELSDLLAQKCEHGPENDINGRPKVLRACAEYHMPEILSGSEATFFFNMPGLQQYVATLRPVEAHAYGKALLDTAKSPASSEEWLERAEVSTMAVVAHYAESVMTRYDRNEDGILDEVEIEDAIPVFAGFIKKVAKDTQKRNLWDSEARAAFFYILVNKTVPTGANWLSISWKMVWTPEVALDRAQLADVFKAIISKLFESSEKKAKQNAAPVAKAS